MTADDIQRALTLLPLDVWMYVVVVTVGDVTRLSTRLCLEVEVLEGALNLGHGMRVLSDGDARVGGGSRSGGEGLDGGPPHGPRGLDLDGLGPGGCNLGPGDCNLGPGWLEHGHGARLVARLVPAAGAVGRAVHGPGDARADWRRVRPLFD